MASQTPTDGPLGNWYRKRIGEPSTDDEVRGYWLFVVGVVFALLGVVLFFSSESAGTMRQWSIVLTAAGLVFLIAGPVIRLPLQRAGTWLALLGVMISVAAIIWFVFAYPAQWSPQTGQFTIIGLYAIGVLIVAASGVAVPIVTGRNELEAQVSALEAEIAALEEAARESEADKEELAEVVADLRSTIPEADSDEADLQKEVDELRTEIADTEADQADLAALLEEIRESQSQFELYQDQGGKWRWRLRHQAGKIIGSSRKGYSRQNEAQESMQAVRRDAYGASVLVIESEADLPDEADTDSFVFGENLESKASFELYSDEGDEYRWRLRHRNGNIIATAGEGYASRRGAEHSIEGIRKYVGPADYLQPDPTAIEVYRDEAGEWRWRLRHRNGKLLASSGEGYASRSGARKVIDRLRDGIPEAEIEVYEDEGGGFRWRLAGEDDKVKVDSGEYESRDGAKAAVERVRSFLPEADIIDLGQAAFEVYQDEGGDHRWRLRHRNGRILATSAQGYSDRSGVWDGIESVKRNAPNAEMAASEE